MNRYKISTGSYVKKSKIDDLVSQAKKQLRLNASQDGLSFCWASGRTDEPLDCSHIISVKRCQELGKSELSWDLNNIQLESRTSHMEWESWEANIEKVKNHDNIDYKLSFIKEHDEESYHRFQSLLGLDTE